MSSSESESGSLRTLWRILSQNRIGMIGFVLSMLQVAIHFSWLLFASALASSGEAQQLTSDDWQMWVIAMLILLGSILTVVSLFLCLYGAIHGRPRVLAVIGLCVSFFFGVMTTFVLLLNALGGGA